MALLSVPPETVPILHDPPSSPSTAAPTSATPATGPPATSPPGPTPSLSLAPVAQRPRPVHELPPGGIYSDAGIEVVGGSVAVRVSADGKPISGATITLYGPTLASKSTDAAGRASLGQLAVGQTYRLVVAAPGYATTQVGAIGISKGVATSTQVDLPAEAVLAGRVLVGGKPLVGAVVSDGLNTALTGDQGQYQLDGVRPGPLTITAAKSRFSTISREMTASAGFAIVTDLAVASQEAPVYFDPDVRPGVALSRFSKLQSSLAERGWKQVVRPPEREGAWVLVCPVQSLEATSVERLVAFVAAGGKLIVLGEWGGFGGFSPTATNMLTHRLGLHFNADLVRDPGASPDPEWPKIVQFQVGHPSATDVSALQLYRSCSLFGLAPMTDLARTQPAAYRVQDNAQKGPHAVVMGGTIGAGKAIVLGDASAFTDDDSDGDGTPNIRESDNSRLAENLFDW